MKNLKIWSLRIVTLAIAAVCLQANAATISREFTGNDCSGYFGTGFDSCTVFVNEGDERIELSPVIAKFGSDLTLDETNDTLFPSVTGSEFSFSNTTGGNKTGTWTYTLGADDPGVRYWATKAANKFLLFWNVADSAVAVGGACDVSDVYVLGCLDAAVVLDSASWSTPQNKNLSHITFYDTAVIPVPAAVWLFGSGLGLLGWMRRKAA
jgi:hypothetical protein